MLKKTNVSIVVDHVFAYMRPGVINRAAWNTSIQYQAKPKPLFP